MDSLTQVVLGAAVGETVLGKKIGNRAMFWGAIGGTIPDLDILVRPLISEMQALISHRGFSHSFLFAVLGAALFGYLVYHIYKSPYYRWMAFLTWMLVASIFSGAVIYLDVLMNGSPAYSIIFGLLLLGGTYLLARKRYLVKTPSPPDADRFDWIKLFFWAFLTHMLLDAFTMYGTQLFWPFSHYRVAFNTISVVDPAYTLPFLVCVMVALFMRRGSKRRLQWNRAGLVISSLYLVFTIGNKRYVDAVFSKALAQQDIPYERCITGPTIMNNVLWNATIENDSVYMHGTYSWFDTSPVLFTPIEKNHELLAEAQDSKAMQTLRWFTKGFYNVEKLPDEKFQVNDLRYGTLHDYKQGETNYVFRFILERNEIGVLEMKKADGGPPPGEERQLLKKLIERIKGR